VFHPFIRMELFGRTDCQVPVAFIQDDAILFIWLKLPLMFP
jgi:hypothetical protein